MPLNARNILLAMLILSCAQTHASNNHKEEFCNLLKLQITNATDGVCYLTQYDVKHGRIVDYPPQSVMSGETKYFELRSFFKGPDIITSYQCNDLTVTFESQQNLCVLSAGDITGQIITSDNGLELIKTTAKGSFLFNEPGMIGWTIRSS